MKHPPAPLAILLAGALMLNATSKAWGRLGEDEARITTRYGEPFAGSSGLGDFKIRVFRTQEYLIKVLFEDGLSCSESYFRDDRKALSNREIQTLLANNSDGKSWSAEPVANGQTDWIRSDNEAYGLCSKDRKRLDVVTRRILKNQKLLKEAVDRQPPQ